MTAEYSNQLFRLAAVLYADNNYEVSPKTIHRKIIESALLSNGNKMMSVHQIIDYIHNEYHITFDEAEVKNIVSHEKEEGFHINVKNEDTIVCLSEKRKIALQSKISNRTIDFFIEQFESENENLVTGTNSKALIYRFLYELLSTNISSFKKLFDNKKNIEELINVESHTYSAIEREIVNTFLSWDNNDKNKAIFDIASYALEYCMISNNGSSPAIHLSSLRNKVFYLDTNVVFRVLGINGQDRQNRTVSFLKKFVDAGEKLTLSKFTESEFKDSVKFYVDKLRKYPLKKLNPSVFQEKHFKSLSSFFDFYHKWRIGKVNDSFELFEAYIISLYEEFKKSFSIDVDYKIPFDLNNEKTANFIKELSNDISSFKTNEEARHTYEGDYNDACNIHFVELRRDGRNVNIFDTKFYFISTDQTLRRWDYNRSNMTPIVILPSQWLSIVLRYINRTNDDFKSFVSFLNLPHSEANIDSEKLHIILAGISEITENFEQQRFLVQSMVQNKFEGILDKGTKDEEILERTITYGKTVLEKNLEDITKRHSKLSDQFDTHKEKTEAEIETLKNVKTEKEQQLTAAELENKKLKELLIENHIKSNIKKWRIPAYGALFLIMMILAFFLLQIFFTSSDYNYVEKLISWIDSNPSETKRDWMRAINTGLVLGLGTLIWFCYGRLISSDDKEDKIEKIKQKLPSKFL